MRLQDRVAVVTGGSSGIGRAIALRFADEGARVVVGDVALEPREGGATTEALLGKRGVHVDADVSRAADVDRLVSTAVDRYGRTIPPYRETREYVAKIVKRVGATQAAAPAAAPRNAIYKSIEVVNGRAIPRYSSSPPASGTYELIKR